MLQQTLKTKAPRYSDSFLFMGLEPTDISQLRFGTHVRRAHRGSLDVTRGAFQMYSHAWGGCAWGTSSFIIRPLGGLWKALPAFPVFQECTSSLIWRSFVGSLQISITADFVVITGAGNTSPMDIEVPLYFFLSVLYSCQSGDYRF